MASCTRLGGFSAGCIAQMFASSDMFDAHCGWPSFTMLIEKLNIKELRDSSFGMIRTEVHSKQGDNHLGHVFDDGPRDCGCLCYCINNDVTSILKRISRRAA